MIDVFFDAFLDSLKMLPLLFVVYVAIEFLEYRYGENIRSKIISANKYGPAIGAAIGSIPQCGFSVVGTTLFTKRMISIGTLIAIYLATSDEAIPVILTQPEHAMMVFPLILTKVVIAVIAGFALDRIFFRKFVPEKHEEPETETSACCGHHVLAGKKKIELILHPLKHTFTVFGFVLVTSIIINLVIYKIGQENLSQFLLANSFFQPVLTALVGLIPNCSASVAITQVYLMGGLSYGSLISGLCTSSGFGLLVLFKQTKSLKEILSVVSILLTVSILAGVIIQLFQ